MKNKKHIDELFKERFKNHETTPPPHVWDNIQATLQERKKDRKVIPLWWKLGGVAALLALLLTIGNSVFNTGKTTDSVVIDDTTTRSINKSEIDKNKDPKTEEDLFNTTQVASETENTSQQTADDTVNGTETSDTKNTPNNRLNPQKKNKTSIALEHTAEETAQQNTIKTTSEKTNKETVVATSGTDNTTSKNTDTSKNNTDTAIASEKDKSEATEHQNGINDGVIAKEKTISEENKTEAATAKTEENLDSSRDDKEIDKKSIFDEIEDAKKAEEAIATNQKPQNRWDVAPNVAPVYYSSLSGGSSIDPAFADNSQSGDVNFSYGVQVAYNITERLSIRSGVNNVNVGYATGAVDVGTGPVAYGHRAINYNGKGTVILTADKGTLRDIGPMDGFGSITPKSTGGNAKIIQDIQYYEVPLELKYAVLDSRFGINMIGGVSTLFLGTNEVSVEDGDFKSVLGEANNLNQVSFTTNVGVGFDYKISKRLKFNVEPMFKYQLNPYSDTSVGFKPYYIGLYSGLSFKF